MQPRQAVLRSLFALILVCLAIPATAATQQQQQERPRPPRDRVIRPGTRAKATLLLTPARRTVTVGDKVRLSVIALGATDLLRFPATLRYDPEVLRLEGVTLGPGWGDGPAPVLLYDASRPGELVLGVARIGNGPALQGAPELLEITFATQAGGRSELHLERFALIGANNRVQPARARSALLVVR